MIEEKNDNWNTAVMEYPFGRKINISVCAFYVEKMYNDLKNKNFEFFS